MLYISFLIHLIIFTCSNSNTFMVKRINNDNIISLYDDNNTLKIKYCKNKLMYKTDLIDINMKIFNNIINDNIEIFEDIHYVVITMNNDEYIKLYKLEKKCDIFL